MRFSIINREPVFEAVRENLERLVNDTEAESNMYQPLTEIRENDKEYNVKIQLPGLKKEDIDVELADNTLTVKAEYKREEKAENEKIHMSEFTYGTFVKSIEFGKETDAEKTRSEYKNGILSITLAKKAECPKDSVKKITIQ